MTRRGMWHLLPLVLACMGQACAVYAEGDIGANNPPDAPPPALDAPAACEGLVRIDLPASYCVRAYPAGAVVPMAYGPDCATVYAPPVGECRAWVTGYPQPVWVRGAVLDVERWPALADGCECE